MKTEAYFRSFFNYWCLTPLMLDLFVFLAGTNGDGRECRTKAYIVPPHAIRCYVDKAAPYVAQLGEACEKKIMEKHAGPLSVYDSTEFLRLNWKEIQAIPP
ncbi:hypothetical protein K7X08_014599 [Anisodus acutangulus]|uniref:Uncharacterized protein n=1 Tax=Anisodus acutangulus TaxID=402998 RepID=A0A9Q1R1D9_9SOLA|nr:hypothetical protein K7X08_014599 [Anisodus acutangulus]